MPVVKSETYPLDSHHTVVEARHIVRQWAAENQLSLVDQTKLVTAASELARNTIIHGGGGTMTIESLLEGIRRGVRITFEDSGPGIPDIELAMRDGYTTGDGLGLGLGGAKRLSNEFAIESKAGKGTRVTITRWS